jgi:hypothetical protein
MGEMNHIGGILVGGTIAMVVLWVLAAVLVDLPGYFVLSLFHARERDPDNLVDIDPTGRKSRIIGLLLWAAAVAVGYLLIGSGNNAG